MITTLLRGNWFLGAACLLLGAHQAQAITIGFSSDSSTAVTFNADGTFQFNGGFSVDLSDSLLQSSVGLQGSIAGTFTIGSITAGIGYQIAPLSGFGTFSISDGGGFSLLATLDLSDIFTTGTGVGTNFNGILNLSGISYSGSNSDLQELASAGNGAIAVSFPFIAPSNLEVLKDGTLNPNPTSYSGILWAEAASVPDGGSTLALLGVALVGVEALRRKLKFG